MAEGLGGRRRPAGHPERRLAVDEVQARLRDDDLVALEPEAALGERLAYAAPPLQLRRELAFFIVAAWKRGKEK